MSELKWKWAYGPYLDPPEGQKESAIRAGYIKVVSKQDADAAIAELKAENERKDKLPESAKRVEARYRVNHKDTRRALWLARAEMAKAWFCYWCARFGVESGFTKCDINGYSVNTTRTLRTIGDWINLWKNVEQKCMAKAEEYK